MLVDIIIKKLAQSIIASRMLLACRGMFTVQVDEKEKILRKFITNKKKKTKRNAFLKIIINSHP